MVYGAMKGVGSQLNLLHLGVGDFNAGGIGGLIEWARTFNPERVLVAAIRFTTV